MAIFLGRMMILSIKTFGVTPSEPREKAIAPNREEVDQALCDTVRISTELQRITDERRTVGNEHPQFFSMKLESIIH